MLSQIPRAKYQEPLFWANGHRQNQAAMAICLGQDSYRGPQVTWRFQRLLHRLGTSSTLGMPLATKRGPSDALVAGLFGFPQIANCFVFKSTSATVRRRRSRREPKAHLKRKANRSQ